jgi:hypothetical protein
MPTKIDCVSLGLCIISAMSVGILFRMSLLDVAALFDWL